MRTAYREQAKYHASPDLILRLVDPDLRSCASKRRRATHRQRDPRVWQNQGKDFGRSGDALPAGAGPGSIDAETARDCGLRQSIYESRGELVDALGLSRPQHDRGLAHRSHAGRLAASRCAARSTAARSQSLERRIKAAVGRNANFLILQLDSEAGDIRHVASLAAELRTLKDNTGVTTGAAPSPTCRRARRSGRRRSSPWDATRS